MGRTIIAPIVALLALLAQPVLGVEVPQELQEQVIYALSEIALAATVLYGFIKNHTDIL